jgi:hypothetical protein
VNRRPGSGTPAKSLDRGSTAVQAIKRTGAQVMHVEWHVDSRYWLVPRIGVTVCLDSDINAAASAIRDGAP